MSVQALGFVWEHHRTTAAEARGVAPLSVHERSVLLSIANYADKDGWNSYPALGTIADETGVGLSTVREICKRLWSQGLIDAERRPGRSRSTRGHFLCFRVVMDLQAVDRKAATRWHLSPYDPDGLDDDGRPDPDETPAPFDVGLDDDLDGAEDPTAPAWTADDDLDGPPGKVLAPGAFPDRKEPDPGGLDPAKGASKVPERCCKGAAKVLAGDPAYRKNREPGTENQNPSSSVLPDRESRAPNPDDDDGRVLAACRLLAERDLDARQHAPGTDPVGSTGRWLEEATRRRLDEHADTLAALALDRPDLDPAGLVDVLSIAAPTPGLSQPGVGARHLPDGSLVLPGTGRITTPEPDPPLTDTERAEALEIARGIPRATRPRAAD